MTRSLIKERLSEIWRIGSTRRVIWFPYHEGFMLLWKENTYNPLMLECLLNPERSWMSHAGYGSMWSKEMRKKRRKSRTLTKTLAMEAVAAAIIAQIAITMLSLPNFDSVHWAATAVACSSLICGILTTFLAFIFQQILSNLHNPEEVRSWLTTTQKSYSLHQVFYPRTRRANATEKTIPSLRSAVLLTTPSKLLRLSIMTAFATLGIYLGCVWDAEVGNLKGRDANFWVLFVFMIVLFVMLQDSFLPFSIVSYDSSRSPDEELQDLSGDVPSPRLVVTSSGAVAAGADDIIRNALESSICAQEESLKAQKALLDLIDGRPSGTMPVTAG